MRNVYGSIKASNIGKQTNTTESNTSNSNNNRQRETKIGSNSSHRMPQLERETTAAEPKAKREQLQSILDNMEMTEDVQCGFWCFKGSKLQKFANEKVYLIMFGLVGCTLAMTRSYLNGTITTLERRYKIPSQNSGILTVGDNISQTVLSAVLGYYAGRSHRPRWIGLGSLVMIISCLLTALPHFIYGPGEDAYAVTEEYGMSYDQNATLAELEFEATKTLCKESGMHAGCTSNHGSWTPQVLIFIAQFIFGIGCGLYYTLGLAYLDDNTKKSNSPRMMSIHVAMSLMGPAIGYVLVSFCLRVFISPLLTPTINQKDPRWLGAWWLGWLIFAALLTLIGLFLTMFPRELPRTKARRLLKEQERLLEAPAAAETRTALQTPSIIPKASFSDMIVTFRRLFKNKVLMFNTFSTCFYFFGYAPYWFFTPKYIEIQFRQSAVASTMLTGSIPLVFSIFGVLLSGFLISKFKPSARFLAGYNILIDILTVAGMLSYVFIGCPNSENSMAVISQESLVSSSCISTCNCDYVRYSPICGDDGLTYLSPCHAGCKNQTIGPDGIMTFSDCYCISDTTSLTHEDLTTTTTVSSDFLAQLSEGDNPYRSSFSGSAVNGSCPVDCKPKLIMFLIVMCCLKMIGSSGRATNILIMMRCVAPEDKSACMGLISMLASVFSFIPAPILFGRLMDSFCLVWGKTCSTKGNCLLYDAVLMRNTLHPTAATFIAIGTLLNVGVWYYIKNIKIFDEEVKTKTQDGNGNASDTKNPMQSNDFISKFST